MQLAIATTFLLCVEECNCSLHFKCILYLHFMYIHLQETLIGKRLQALSYTCCRIFCHFRTFSSRLQAILANTITVLKNSFWHSLGFISLGACRSMLWELSIAWLELSWPKPFESGDCSHELCPAHLFTASWDGLLASQTNWSYG